MATPSAERLYTPLNVRLSPYTPHYPEPPQEAFLATTELEALYGGSAGGGKSDALLIAALQYVDEPGYSAILFRRTYTDLALPGAIMDRSKQWLAGTDAAWKDTDKTWRFPSGATLAFGYLQTASDKYRYQSAEFQFVGFDELTQFPEQDYLYLFSRLRRLQGATVPLRMRGASNPGGIGHKWVLDRFNPIGPSPSDARVFIPAKLSDNPHIDQDSYRKSLAELDPQTRAQLEHGDWTARPPGDWVFDQHGIDAAERLGREFDELHLSGELVPDGDSIGLGVDWGENTHAVVVWPLEQGGVYVPPGEVIAAGVEPGEATRRMLAAAAVYDFPLRYARYDAAGVQSMRTFRSVAPDTVTIKAVPFGKYKQQNVGYLRWLFRRAAEGHRTRIIAISPRNTELLRQLRGMAFSDQDVGKVDKGDDHGPDALIAGINQIASAHRDQSMKEAV
jgi:hypothetical protein